MMIKLSPLPTLNEYIKAERSNRYIAAKMKKQYTEQVAWELKAQKVRVVGKINKLTCVWSEKNKRRDPDNIAFAVKFILDGMQLAGVIKNDGWKLWSGNPVIHHKFEVGEPGVTVLIK